MIHPANLVDWEAVANCEVCEKDTDHYFAAPYGVRTVTYLTCEECGHETELDPEDFEE